MRKISLFMIIALDGVLLSAAFTISELVSVDKWDCCSVFLCDQKEIMPDIRG